MDAAGATADAAAIDPRRVGAGNRAGRIASVARCGEARTTGARAGLTTRARTRADARGGAVARRGTPDFYLGLGTLDVFGEAGTMKRGFSPCGPLLTSRGRQHVFRTSPYIPALRSPIDHRPTGTPLKYNMRSLVGLSVVVLLPLPLLLQVRSLTKCTTSKMNVIIRAEGISQ